MVRPLALLTITGERRTIRLACENCDRDDCDGLTPSELEVCKSLGWERVVEEQSYEESCRGYGPSVFDWYTHLGWCPNCVAAGANL